MEISNNLNIKSLVQIINNHKNAGQGEIKKMLKTIYHIKYKSKNYSIKKDILNYNIHGQVVANFNDLKQLNS
jgi:hypothetical protein